MNKMDIDHSQTMTGTPMQMLTHKEAFAMCDSKTIIQATELPAQYVHDVSSFVGEPTEMKQSSYEDSLFRKDVAGTPIVSYPATFDENRNGWRASLGSGTQTRQALPMKASVEDEMLETENYRETPEGLFLKHHNGEETRVTNVRIRIRKKILRYSDQDHVREHYSVEVHSAFWDSPKMMEPIAKEKMKDLFELIKREYVDAYILTNAPRAHDVLELYRTDVFRLSQQSWEIVRVAERRGWIQLKGTISYEPGDDPYYHSAPIPNISHLSTEQRRQVFIDGNRMLDVGRRGAAIGALAVFSHMGYSNFWFEKIGIPCQFALFLHGETGSGKTQICREISNVFETDRRKKNLRFSATDASFAEMVEMVQDSCILIDDFSATHSKTQKEALTALEKRLRIAGDRDLPTKMRHGRLHQYMLRSVILMTGETEAAGLAKSSTLRAISVPLRKENVDWRVLSEFQEHAERMKLYFAWYIEYLSERMPSYLHKLRADVQRSRAERTYYKEARLRDASILFEIQTELIRDFAMWMGLSEAEADKAVAPFLQIHDILRENARASRLLTAAERFLIGFQQALNEFPGAAIAKTEEEYASNEAAFVGFYAEDALWLNFEKASGIVKKFYYQQGEEVVMSPDQIKKQLHEAQILRASKNSKGTMDYVKRAKKGSRKRMVVLGKIAMDKALKRLLEEE